MTLTRFFVNIRRFNALLPALALLVFAMVLAWGFLSQNKERPPKTVVAPDQVARVPGDALELRKLDVDLDLGPKLVLLKVTSKRKSGSSYESSEIRNLVFVGDDSETLKWVFPTQKQELVSVHPVKASDGVIKGIYVEAIDKTTDAVTSTGNLSSVYLVFADGSGYKKVLSDVDEVVSRRNDDNKLRLIYQKQNSVRMALINMQDFRVLADRELATMSEFKK
jgi:hypothetical protein